MLAHDVMAAKLVTARESTTIAEAARLMSEHDVSALPVVDESGRLVGVVSEADLLRRSEIGTEIARPWWQEALLPAFLLAKDFVRAHGREVRDVMSTPVVSAPPTASLGEIATLMERHRIKRIPIVEEGRLVGVVSRANLVQALASVQVAPAGAAIDVDRAIRAELLSRLLEQSWTDFGDRNVTVSEGVVRLWGLVGSPEERKALVALAAEVPGVKRVEDEMFPAY
ncbi:MAG TPA: CBS domain-containing protein [Methylocystis sp.]|nr:CBS domain-containing protein [Methylocystis sp.]